MYYTIVREISTNSKSSDHQIFPTKISDRTGRLFEVIGLSAWSGKSSFFCFQGYEIEFFSFRLLLRCRFKILVVVFLLAKHLQSSLFYCRKSTYSFLFHKVMASSAHYFHTCPYTCLSVASFPKLVETMPVVTLLLAKWIIDDSCLALLYLWNNRLLIDPLGRLQVRTFVTLKTVLANKTNIYCRSDYGLAEWIIDNYCLAICNIFSFYGRNISEFPSYQWFVIFSLLT